MSEGQIVRRVRPAAILAGEAVAQDHVEPGEGRVARRLDIVLQRDDAGQPHLERWAAHIRVVMIDDVDAVEKHRLDRVLPRPERQWEIAERTKIRVEHQGRTAIERTRHRKTFRSSRPPAKACDRAALIPDRPCAGKVWPNFVSTSRAINTRNTPKLEPDLAGPTSRAQLPHQPGPAVEDRQNRIR